MNAQASNQIAISLASAENLMQAIYAVVEQSNNTDAVVETLLDKLHGDIQSIRAAFVNLIPDFKN